MSDTVLLRTPFTPEQGSGLLTSLVLFADRLEVRRLGVCTRVVPLHEVERVTVSTLGTEPVNFRVATRSGDALAGTIKGVLAWKYKLMELIDVRERTAPLPEPQVYLAVAA